MIFNVSIRRILLLVSLLCCIGSPQAIAQSALEQQMTESDRQQLQAASNACANKDFVSFFQAFTRSKVVRDRHSSNQIMVWKAGRSQSVAKENYNKFPIALSDYTYVWTSPKNTSPNQKQYLRVKFIDLPQSEHRVDWERVRYAGNGNDRDGSGTIIGTIGTPGSLLFKPFNSCWQLVSDRNGIPRADTRR